MNAQFVYIVGYSEVKGTAQTPCHAVCETLHVAKEVAQLLWTGGCNGSDTVKQHWQPEKGQHPYWVWCPNDEILIYITKRLVRHS